VLIERHQVGLQPGDMLGQGQLGATRRLQQAVDVEPTLAVIPSMG
jgi:hypothetical protein